MENIDAIELPAILIVDDRPENLEAVESVLSELKIKLVKAGSGEEALRAVLQQEFAAILLDVQMPGMDGFETAALIRQRERSAHTPIIFLTAIEHSEERAFQGYQSGAVDYIFKPFNPEILRAKVSVFVDLWAMRHALAASEASLRRMNEALEERVIERTAELRNVTKHLQYELTERKQAEQALHIYASKLEQSNRDLQEFAYVASHDLQEPLRKVQAFSDRLTSKYEAALDETGRDYLKRMRDASQRMQTLINALLDFSRLSSRAQPFTEVNLNTVAQEALSNLENQIERTKGRVEIGNLPALEADPSQMRQLLQNLISNALKFHQDDVPPIAQLSAQVEDGKCRLSITDNGIGFDTQYLDRIFKPFQRLHNYEEYEGSGMGLAICRRIVERHAGSITAVSAAGEGTAFLVTLPIHQSKENI